MNTKIEARNLTLHDIYRYYMAYHITYKANVSISLKRMKDKTNKKIKKWD